MFTSNYKYNFIDVFSGAGGLSEGFFNCGYNPIAHVEMNGFASDTLRTRSCYYYLKKTGNLNYYYNYLRGSISKEQLYEKVPKEVLMTVINEEISDKTYKSIFYKIDDIMKKDNIKEVDVLIGGPPCQAYSLVGRASTQGGMENDPRNDLYIQYARFLNKYVDRDIYRIAIEMWNDNHRRLHYTDLPENLQFHNNRVSFLDRFKVVEGDMESAHTMLAHISKDGHYYIHPDIEQARSLSVREAARIQSFPDNYYFEGPRTAKFVQIGNAVPPLMAKGIATAIKNLLDGLEK